MSAPGSTGAPRQGRTEELRGYLQAASDLSAIARARVTDAALDTVRAEVERVGAALGLAGVEEVARLRRTVERLERRVLALEGGAPAARSSGRPAPRASGRPRGAGAPRPADPLEPGVPAPGVPGPLPAGGAEVPDLGATGDRPAPTRRAPVRRPRPAQDAPGEPGAAQPGAAQPAAAAGGVPGPLPGDGLG